MLSNMKILFLNNYHYIRGGSEQVFFGEMDLLKKASHDVQSFARRTNQDIQSDHSFLFPEDMTTDSLSFGFGVFRTLKEIIYSLESKNQLERFIEHFQPDIAHAHNIYGRLTTSVLDLLNEKKIPVIMTLHDYKIVCPNYRLMYGNRICEDCNGKNFYHAIKNRCHKKSITASGIYAFESWFNSFFQKYRANVTYFVSPSRFLKEKFTEFGWPGKQIVYIPNYIVSKDIVPNYEFEDYLLYLGRLSSEKGIATLIKAFKQLNDGNTGLKIVGDGPERKHLESLSADDDRINFTGYLSGKKLSDVTRKARGIVIPSEWYENAPISILEAFAYGKPVIGSRIGGIPELIEDDFTGLVFEPADEDDLKAKMESFLSKSKNAIVDMGKAARNKVELQFSAEAHYRQLIELYNKALSK